MVKTVTHQKNGEDYFTPQEIAEIEEQVKNSIINSDEFNIIIEE